MNLLKKIRKQRKESLSTVAVGTGVSACTLSRIENGLQKPSPGLAEKIAKHFGYAITEIQLLYPERFKNED